MNARALERLGPHGAFGLALCAAAKRDDRVVALTADLGNASGLGRFSRTYPVRFWNVGIAEQNLVGVAAGLAEEGRIPFATSFAAFIAMRSCEQVRHHLGLMQRNVKLVGIGAGLTMRHFGADHCGDEDLGIIRAIGGIKIWRPVDCTEVYDSVLEIAEHDGPAYLRLEEIK